MVGEGRLLLHQCLNGHFLRSLSNLEKELLIWGYSFMIHSHPCDVEWHRKKSVSVTGKHLLMRNKKQKPMESVIEQAIRKAYCKVKISHRHLGIGFKRIRLIFLNDFSFLFIHASLPCVCT